MVQKHIFIYIQVDADIYMAAIAGVATHAIAYYGFN